jgi:hypothetical protein
MNSKRKYHLTNFVYLAKGYGFDLSNLTYKDINKVFYELGYLKQDSTSKNYYISLAIYNDVERLAKYCLVKHLENCKLEEAV